MGVCLKNYFPHWNVISLEGDARHVGLFRLIKNEDEDVDQDVEDSDIGQDMDENRDEEDDHWWGWGRIRGGLRFLKGSGWGGWWHIWNSFEEGSVSVDHKCWLLSGWWRWRLWCCWWWWFRWHVELVWRRKLGLNSRHSSSRVLLLKMTIVMTIIAIMLVSPIMVMAQMWRRRMFKMVNWLPRWRNMLWLVDRLQHLRR